MDNYMKGFYEDQVKTSETKIKLMESGLKRILSDPNNIEVESLSLYVNAINSEKSFLLSAKKNLDEYVSGVAQKKKEAKMKLGIIEVAHE